MSKGKVTSHSEKGDGEMSMAIMSKKDRLAAHAKLKKVKKPKAAKAAKD